MESGPVVRMVCLKRKVSAVLDSPPQLISTFKRPRRTSGEGDSDATTSGIQTEKEDYERLGGGSSASAEGIGNLIRRRFGAGAKLRLRVLELRADARGEREEYVSEKRFGQIAACRELSLSDLEGAEAMDDEEELHFYLPTAAAGASTATEVPVDLPDNAFPGHKACCSDSGLTSPPVDADSWEWVWSATDPTESTLVPETRAEEITSDAESEDSNAESWYGNDYPEEEEGADNDSDLGLEDKISHLDVYDF